MAAQGEASVKLTLIDRLTAPLTRIKAKLAMLGKNLGLDRIGAQLKNVGNAFANLGDGLARSAMRFATVATVLGAAAAGIAVAAFKIANDTAELGAGLKESSTKLGIGVEPLQEWRYAAKMSAVDAEQLDKAIAKLGVNASSSVRGNKTMAKSFKALGVNVKDANGKMKPTEKILEETMNALADMKDPLRRNELAMKLFGKSGVELAKMMGDGSKGIKELREEARRTGNVISDETASMGDTFGDNLDKLKEYIQGLKNTLGAALLPVMNDVVIKITAWVDANRELLKQKINEWADKFAQVVRDLMDPTSELRKNIDGIVDGFRQFGDNITAAYAAATPFVDYVGGPMNAALIALGTWVMAPAIAALASLAAAFIKLGAVMLTTPFGWIVLGVAAVAASVYVLYQKWDEFVAYWGNLWGRIKSAFDKSWSEGIATALKEFNPLTHIVRGWDAVIEYFTGISLLEEGSRIIKSFEDGIKKAWPGISLDIQEQWIIIREETKQLFGKFTKLGEDIISALWNGLKSKWAEVTGWMAEQIENLVPDWAPQWLKDGLGFNVDGKPGRDGKDGTTKKDGVHPPPADRAAANDNWGPVTPDFGSYLNDILARFGRSFVTDGTEPKKREPVSTAAEDRADRARGATKTTVDPAPKKEREPASGGFLKDILKTMGRRAFGPDTSGINKVAADVVKIEPARVETPRIDSPRVDMPSVSSVIQLQDAIRARAANIGGATTDTLPGKTKDDLDTGRSQNISAANLNVGSVTMPEPIVAHEPQVVNAPFNVGGMTFNVQSDPNAIASAVSSALSAQAAKQAAAVKSSLSD